MNSMSIELALTTGMHRGEVCALRWSDFDDAGAMTVSHALGNGPGGFYLKEPKTGSFARHPPHQPHDDDAQGHAGRHAPCYGRDGYGRGRPLHPGHSSVGQPSLQPHAARQGLLRLLQDGRFFLHVPRPAPHARHHDDRGRLRRAHGGELPRTRERVDDARHLRRHRPRGKMRRRRQGGRELRRGHERHGLRRAREIRGNQHEQPHVHRRAAGGHACRGQAEKGRPWGRLGHCCGCRRLSRA